MPLHHQPKVRAAQCDAAGRSFTRRYEIEGGAIGFGELACDIEPQSGTARFSGEKRLEQLAGVFLRDAIKPGVGIK